LASLQASRRKLQTLAVWQFGGHIEFDATLNTPRSARRQESRSMAGGYPPPFDPRDNPRACRDSDRQRFAVGHAFHFAFGVVTVLPRLTISTMGYSNGSDGMSRHSRVKLREFDSAKINESVVKTDLTQDTPCEQGGI
jgi:hypothetical protein